MRLRKAFDLCGCDRGFRHGYEAVYEPACKSWRWLLEVGIYKGAGIAAWLVHLPHIRVMGIDTFQRVPSKAIPLLCHDRVTWREGDSRTIDVPGLFDAIIDDGNHDPKAQRLTFLNLFHRLERHGSYFIEDCDPRKPGFDELLEVIEPYNVTHHDRRKTNQPDSYILEIRSEQPLKQAA